MNQGKSYAAAVRCNGWFAANLAPHREVRRKRTPTIEVIVGLGCNLLVACGSRIPRCIQVIVHVSDGNLEPNVVRIVRGLDERAGVLDALASPRCRILPLA